MSSSIDLSNLQKQMHRSFAMLWNQIRLTYHDLANALPAHLRAKLKRDTLLLVFEDNELFVRTSGALLSYREGSLGHHHFEQTLVILRIPDEHVIVQPITMPAEAAKSIHETLDLIIAQYSPFEPHEVVASARIVDTSVTDGLCRLELCYCLQEDVADLRKALPDHCLLPDALLLRDGHSLVFLSTEKRRALRKRLAIASFAWLSPIICFVVLGLALGIKQSSDLSALKRALNQELAIAKQRTALEQKIAEAVRLRSRPAQGVGAMPEHAELIIALARSLPEDAKVRELEIGQDSGRVVFTTATHGDPAGFLSGVNGIRLLESSASSASLSGERLNSLSFAVEPRRNP